jgi:hypothetical protein
MRSLAIIIKLNHNLRHNNCQSFLKNNRQIQRRAKIKTTKTKIKINNSNQSQQSRKIYKITIVITNTIKIIFYII